MSESVPASAVHLLRLQNLTLLTDSEIILQEPCFGNIPQEWNCVFHLFGKNIAFILFFSEACSEACFACCLEVRSLCFTRGSVAPGSLCHPWERECVFMGRMLCPYDPRVNPAVICAIKVLTSVWRGKLFVFTACLVRGEMTEGRLPIYSVPTPWERKAHAMMSHCVPDSN